MFKTFKQHIFVSFRQSFRSFSTAPNEVEKIKLREFLQSHIDKIRPTINLQSPSTLAKYIMTISGNPLTNSLEGFSQVVTFLTLEDINKIGQLPPEAIIAVKDSTIITDNFKDFTTNRAFRLFLYDVIAKNIHLYSTNDIESSGNAIILDQRISSAEELTIHDVIGFISLKNGIASSFNPSPFHRIISQNGKITGVPLFLERKIFEEFHRKE